jgi:DNA-binding CsgD family transcriptional regulator
MQRRQTDRLDQELTPSDLGTDGGGVVKVVRQFASVSRLSDRESQVLCRAAEGRSMKEAAAELGISIKTVGDYWSRIYAKTGDRSQLEVVARLLRTML